MVKFIALYKKPADVAEFEKRYFDEHLPLAKKMPGLKKVEISRIVGSPRGESEYYLMAELYWDDMEAMKAGLGSQESKDAGKVLMSFAKDITTMMFAEPEAKPVRA
ncbi:MAG TPA: EthD family reductase [Candidatus Obscuribacterales bacterium]